MAYVSQELKAKLTPTIKAICKKYGVKASLAVRNHSTLVLNVKQGRIDFIGNFNNIAKNRNTALGPAVAAENYIGVNVYWFQEHFDGRARNFLSEIIPAMKGADYFDDSDSMTDYFHCSHYFSVNIGRWGRPYALEK